MIGSCKLQVVLVPRGVDTVPSPSVNRRWTTGQRWSTAAVNGGQRRSTPPDHRRTTAGPSPDHQSTSGSWPGIRPGQVGSGSGQDRVWSGSSSSRVRHVAADVDNEGSMFDARHELCFLEFVSDMNASSKSKSVKKAKKKEEWKPTGKVFTKIGYNWRPIGRTFTLVGNACPLTRITATNKVPLREPIPLEVSAQ
ncbi:hypothetical protein Tco_0477391 [Tanacetum coccineum]